MGSVWESVQGWFGSSPVVAKEALPQHAALAPGATDPSVAVVAAREEARRKEAVHQESRKWDAAELALKNEVAVTRQQAAWLKQRFEEQGTRMYDDYADVSDFKISAEEAQRYHRHAIIGAQQVIQTEIADYTAHSRSVAAKLLHLVRLQDAVRSGKPFKTELEAITDFADSSVPKDSVVVPFAAVHTDVLEASAVGVPSVSTLQARVQALAQRATGFNDDGVGSSAGAAERGLRAAAGAVTGTSVTFEEQARAAACAKKRDWTCVHSALSSWGRQFPDNRFDAADLAKLKQETRGLADAAAVQKRTDDLMALAIARVRVLQETVAG